MNVRTTRRQALQTLGLSGLAPLTSWLLRKAAKLIRVPSRLLRREWNPIVVGVGNPAGHLAARRDES